MTSTSSNQFRPVGPVHLFVENGRGSVTITAGDTTEASVDVTGPDVDAVQVELDGNNLHVSAPQQRSGFFGNDRHYDMTITVPAGSELTAKLGSADLTCTGTLGASSVRSGSGHVDLAHLSGPALLETGSGDVRITATEQALKVKSGSGGVAVDRADAEMSISTGSGDVEIGHCRGRTSVKTGSGDLAVTHAHTDLSLATGSGDLIVGQVSSGRIQLKGASGDLRVGVPAGIPVWTDVSTISGRLHSTLEGAGQPEPGADYVEVVATTVSGDIDLHQL